MDRCIHHPRHPQHSNARTVNKKPMAQADKHPCSMLTAWAGISDEQSLNDAGGSCSRISSMVLQTFTIASLMAQLFSCCARRICFPPPCAQRHRLGSAHAHAIEKGACMTQAVWAAVTIICCLRPGASDLLVQPVASKSVVHAHCQEEVQLAWLQLARLCCHVGTQHDPIMSCTPAVCIQPTMIECASETHIEQPDYSIWNCNTHRLAPMKQAGMRNVHVLGPCACLAEHAP